MEELMSRADIALKRSSAQLNQGAAFVAAYPSMTQQSIQIESDQATLQREVEVSHSRLDSQKHERVDSK